MRATVLALLLLALGATPAAAAGRTVVFGLTATPQERPAQVPLQADAGPSLQELTWTDWGAARTTGTGTWVLDCTRGGPSCGTDTGVTRHPARYTLTRPAACPRLGPDVRAYTRGTLVVDEPTGPRTVRLDPGREACARAPSLAAATRAIRRFLLRRGPVERLRVRCDRPTGGDRECRARYRSRGRARTLDVFVLGRLAGAPEVRPVG
ncbi:hypothetical protein GKE82_15900 [Conexibacter sp. W3-3-2]|uniref:hypothetical protein n=1 Tax=Conexibacter sp. W3-3-2 TaxID=2675227 RepID=UPI0012B7B10F|nr:hypothetical protein [Conexibacter sp. W3-3-2]MTD45731.1 hypothetical protein [Conexibacter sp. W3-3-2]